MNPARLEVEFEGTGIQMIGVQYIDMGDFTATVDDTKTVSWQYVFGNKERGRSLLKFPVYNMENIS